jgi:hypothetical protein
LMTAMEPGTEVATAPRPGNPIGSAPRAASPSTLLLARPHMDCTDLRSSQPSRAAAAPPCSRRIEAGQVVQLPYALFGRFVAHGSRSAVSAAFRAAARAALPRLPNRGRAARARHRRRTASRRTPRRPRCRAQVAHRSRAAATPRRAGARHTGPGAGSDGSWPSARSSRRAMPIVATWKSCRRDQRLT